MIPWGRPSTAPAGKTPERRVDASCRYRPAWHEPAAERDYFRRTGIFPIMHAVAMRNDIIDAHPWLPTAVR